MGWSTGPASNDVSRCRADGRSERTLGSTTFSVSEVMRATIHSRVFICSATMPEALRKWCGKLTLKAAHTGTAELRVGRKSARSPLAKLSRGQRHDQHSIRECEAETSAHLRKAILSFAPLVARCARSRYALASLTHFFVTLVRPSTLFLTASVSVSWLYFSSSASKSSRSPDT